MEVATQGHVGRAWLMTAIGWRAHVADLSSWLSMSLLRAGLWLSAGIAAGRLAGFVREAILARRYGLSSDADVAVVVLTLPDSLLNILIGSAMAAALVPALAAQRQVHGQAGVDRLHAQIAALAVVLGGLLTCALIVVSRPLVQILNPGLAPAQVAQAAELIGVALWAVPLTVLSSVVGAGLQERERFASTALGTLWFNGAVIFALLLWWQEGHEGHEGQEMLVAMAWAMIAGAALRVGLQLCEWRAVGGGWAWLGGGWLPERRMAVSYLHILAAGGALLLLPLAGRWFASFAGSGSIAGWTYASKLFELPLQVLVTVFATALFPRFSRLLAAGDEPRARAFLNLGGQVVLICATTAAIIIAALAPEVVAVAFHLPAADGEKIVGLLRCLLIALPFAGLSALLQAWYAADRDTRTPVLAGSISVAVFFAAGWPVMQTWGLPGLAWLSAAQYVLTCGLLLVRATVRRSLTARALLPVLVAGGIAAGGCAVLCLLSHTPAEPMVRLLLAAVVGIVALAAGLAMVPGIRSLAQK
jgi:murein biosynthesis integral membrane protein MurJ